MCGYRLIIVKILRFQSNKRGRGEPAVGNFFSCCPLYSTVHPSESGVTWLEKQPTLVVVIR